MLLKNNIFKRLLIFLILMLFSLLLLYTDYLQEVNFYQNRLQLRSFSVGFETYRLIQECSIWGQTQIIQTESILDNNKLDKKKGDLFESNINLNNNDYFSLNPPLPEIELTNIGPVFLENGLIHLYCEYNFVNIKCRIDGEIPTKKIYFLSTYFKNTNFETISLKFGINELFGSFKMKYSIKNTNTNQNSINRVYQETLKANINNVELFTNYIMLFGANGTNIDFFLNDERENLDKMSVLSRYKYYNFVHNQVGTLFTLFYFKLTNFILFATTIILHFLLHSPIYFFNCFKYEPFISDTEKKQNNEYDIKGFTEWVDNNHNIEKKLRIFDDSENIYESKVLKLNSPHNSVRLRKISNSLGNPTNINVQMPSPCFTTAKYCENIKPNNQSPPISVSTTTISSQSIHAIKSDLENQECLNEFKISNSTLVNAELFDNKNGSLGNNVVFASKMDQIIDTYCLFYLISSVYVVLHLIIYEILNIVLYNLISGILKSLEESEPNNLNTNIKSIFGIPTVILGDSSSFIDVNQIHRHSNMVFSALLNLCGCLFNMLMAFFFHGIYIYMIYKYTISIC